MYALRRVSTGQFIGFTVSPSYSNEFCGETVWTLEESDTQLWVTASFSEAVRAACNSTPWYNACFSTPINPFVGDIEIVSLLESEVIPQDMWHKRSEFRDW